MIVMRSSFWLALSPSFQDLPPMARDRYRACSSLELCAGQITTHNIKGSIFHVREMLNTCGSVKRNNSIVCECSLLWAVWTQGLYIGCCPNPVIIYTRGHIKVYIQLYSKYYPAATEWGRYPSYASPKHQQSGALKSCQSEHLWLFF